jgi:hypothetical protein
MAQLMTQPWLTLMILSFSIAEALRPVEGRTSRQAKCEHLQENKGSKRQKPLQR